MGSGIGWLTGLTPSTCNGPFHALTIAKLFQKPHQSRTAKYLILNPRKSQFHAIRKQHFQVHSVAA